MELAAPLIILLCFILLEASILQFIKKVNVNWQDIIFNLNSGHIMLWLFRGLEIICFNYLYTNFSLHLFANIPILLTWIFAILAWDFGFYWLHRLHHTIPLFWAVHIVHHQGEHFNLSLAMRNSWYSSLTSIPFFAFLAILGVPTSIFITVSIIHYSIQFFNHNALTPKLGFLEKIFVTPDHHRVHHVKDKFYSNHNFGGSFIFWDKLFGSFQDSLPQTKFSYGSYEISSQNPLFANNLPFLQLFNFQYSPAKKIVQYKLSNILFVTGGFLLFILTICYIFSYGYGYINASIPQYLFFICLVLGTLSLGGIADGQKWGIFSWFVLTLTLPILFIYILQWDFLYWKIFIGLITIHGIISFCTWFKNYENNKI